MESVLPSIQHILSGVLGEAPQDTMSNTTSPTAGSVSMPANALGFISLMLSFSALREWLKLILLGGFFETCRRMFSSIYSKIISRFYLTVEFHEDDGSYGAYPTTGTDTSDEVFACNRLDDGLALQTKDMGYVRDIS
jgi:chaperone BCS1